MKILLLCLVLVLTGCHLSQPLFIEGEIVEGKLAGKRGQIRSVDCFTGCSYLVRFGYDDYSLVRVQEDELAKVEKNNETKRICGSEYGVCERPTGISTTAGVSE